MTTDQHVLTVAQIFPSLQNQHYLGMTEKNVVWKINSAGKRENKQSIQVSSRLMIVKNQWNRSLAILHGCVRNGFYMDWFDSNILIGLHDIICFDSKWSERWKSCTLVTPWAKGHIKRFEHLSGWNFIGCTRTLVFNEHLVVSGKKIFERGVKQGQEYLRTFSTHLRSINILSFKVEPLISSEVEV